MSVQNNKDEALRQYVVHHKQTERRMDGSAGSFYCALLEAISKDGWYFSGTVFNDEFRLIHTITNDFERIPDLLGYKPLRSDISKAIPTIKKLLDNGETVLFCGTSEQCKKVKESTTNTDNLFLVDIIDNLFASDNVLKVYINNIQDTYGSKVVDIRFFDKEFQYTRAKRIKLDNGQVIFSRSRDLFDEEFEREILSKADEKHEKTSFNYQGDITIASYNMPKGGDSLGYSYVRVNTEKGDCLFERIKKRLEIVLVDDQVVPSNILTDQIIIDLIKRNNRQTKGLKARIKSFLKKHGVADFVTSFQCLIETSQLKIKPICQFFYYNFFSKNVITDKKHNGYVYFTPYCSLQIEKDAIIEVHGPLIIGRKRVKCSKQDTRLWMQPGAKILVHEGASFGYGSTIEIYKGALLEIGSLSSNSEIVVICGKYIKLGSSVNIARGCTIRDTNGHFVSVTGYKMMRAVKLGNHVWICSNSTIMPGVTIEDGAIVGACSFITKKVPAFTMVQGSADNVVGYPKYFRM